MSPGMRTYIDTRTPEKLRPAVLAWFLHFEKECEEKPVAFLVAWLLDAVAKLQRQAFESESHVGTDEAIVVIPIAAALLHKASDRLVEECFGVAQEEEVPV